MATKTAEELIAELQALGLSEEDIARKTRKAKVDRVRSHFATLLKDDSGVDLIAFKVKDWRALREFMKEPPTQAANPGGDVHHDLIVDTKDAIADKDEARLIHNLLLIYKAVQRG